jgi:ferritin-like metal-binding protein YciE
VLDAGLIACAQAVEHYEMARYGALKTWAELLGYDAAVPLLQETLDQEHAANDALSMVAEEVNQMAMAAE